MGNSWGSGGLSHKIKEGMGVQTGFVITGLTASPTESLLQQRNL